MHITDPRIESYCVTHSTPVDAVLAELERRTYLTQILPRMLSGPWQARLLHLLVKMRAPARVLEIGTFTGYSAIAMASALPEGGRLDTIEQNEELEGVIREFVDKAGLSDRIRLHIGDAFDVLDTLDSGFDFVFLDADKERYPDYLDVLVPMMTPGGVLIADNVLWDGKVVGAEDDSDRQTRGIRRFNERVLAHPALENVIIPLRDGVNLIVKK